MRYLTGVIAGACLFLISSLAYGQGTESSQTPQQAIEVFLDNVRQMEFPVTDPAKHKQLVSQANAYLDLETMGSAALADHWGSMSADDKKTFFDLLWKLVESVAYPRNQGLMNDEKISYGETVKTEHGFQVPLALERKTDAEAPSASLSYQVVQKEGRWKINDVVLDDVSIIEDLKYQFDKIIAKSQIGGLLQKMQERLEKAKVENQNEKP